MVLCMLRLEFVSRQIGVPRSTVSDTFHKIVNALFKSLNFRIWPNSRAIVYVIPAHFKKYFPRLTQILDCFERTSTIHLREECNKPHHFDHPKNLKSWQQVYSNYKKLRQPHGACYIPLWGVWWTFVWPDHQGKWIRLQQNPLDWWSDHGGSRLHVNWRVFRCLQRNSSGTYINEGKEATWTQRHSRKKKPETWLMYTYMLSESSGRWRRGIEYSRGKGGWKCCLRRMEKILCWIKTTILWKSQRSSWQWWDHWEYQPDKTDSIQVNPEFQINYTTKYADSDLI